MMLFYFTSEKFGLEAIQKRQLKISRINELNDPFEFLGLQLERDDRRKLKKWKASMAEHYGLICMSSDWQHPLLWGHYADKHRGICLGFDVSADLGFTKVTYSRERLKLNDLGRESVDSLDSVDMKRLLFTKFDAWMYESEYRIFTTLHDKEPESGLYFLSFSDQMRLSQVIVGEGASLTRAELAGVLGDKFGGVNCFKARAGFKNFRVEENRYQSAWK